MQLFCPRPFFPCLFQDFRNYQYTLPVVKGLVVDMEVKRTSIKIPSNRYNEVSAVHLVITMTTSHTPHLVVLSIKGTHCIHDTNLLCIRKYLAYVMSHVEHGGFFCLNITRALLRCDSYVLFYKKLLEYTERCAAVGTDL